MNMLKGVGKGNIFYDHCKYSCYHGRELNHYIILINVRIVLVNLVSSINTVSSCVKITW